MKFKGTLNQLQVDLAEAGLEGKWDTDDTGKHVFRHVNGAVMNWWPSKGTVQCQGPKLEREALEKDLARIFNEKGTPLSTPHVAKGIAGQKYIFIVHGHDGSSRDELELALRRLGLEPFILMNTSGGGQTLIEALEGQIGKDHSADFGIVLITPDDMGYAKTEGESKIEPRARQNVILETGMLISSLTRSRMALVVKGHVELPSDLQGVIQLRYNDHVRDIIPKLIERLQSSGFEIDSRKIASATA